MIKTISFDLWTEIMRVVRGVLEKQEWDPRCIEFSLFWDNNYCIWQLALHKYGMLSQFSLECLPIPYAETSEIQPFLEDLRDMVRSFCGAVSKVQKEFPGSD